MRKLYLFAAMAAMLASCSSDDLTKESAVAQETDAGIIAFDSYVQRGTTRAGDVGTMVYNTGNFQKLTSTGFGVFGYYTDNNEYDGLTIPDFFYNQEVEYGTSGPWTYSPIKYWPNEYGNSAIADDNDKVSFFAYAPYVTANPATGKVQEQTWGITQLSRNSVAGDPFVKYIASFDWTKSVDLLWGVVPSTNTWALVSGQTQTFATGLPWLNVERPNEAKSQSEATQRVKFDFKHALAKLNVQVDYDADAATESSTEIGSTTRVYVRSISFTGFSMKGALNLNNTTPNTPLWMAYDAQNEQETGEVTIVNDGRKDGQEGRAADASEKNPYLNPAIIQKLAWSNDNKGVLATAQNVFNFPGAKEVAEDLRTSPSAGTIDASKVSKFSEATGLAAPASLSYTTHAAKLQGWPIMVIPNGEEMTITIVYDVETVDANLAKTLSDGSMKGSSIENRITKTITFNKETNYLEAGKQYQVKLHLGLNSVKFDAAVTGWEDAFEGGEGNGWLPYNQTSFQAPGLYNYNIAASATYKSEMFQITGFASGEAVTYSPKIMNYYSKTQADAEGIITGCQLKDLTKNNTVMTKITDEYASVTGAVSGKAVTFNLVQDAAQPYYDGTSTYSTLTFSSETGTFTLKDNTGTAVLGSIWVSTDRNVQIISATRDGESMTEVDTTPTSTLQFQITDGDGTGNTGTIVLNAAPTKGEVFIFRIKAGDADEFSVRCTIP